MPGRRRHFCSYIIFVSGYADVSQTSLKAFHVCVLHAGRGALAIAIASSVVVVIAVTAAAAAAAAAAAPAANMILAGVAALALDSGIVVISFFPNATALSTLTVFQYRIRRASRYVCR